MLTATVSRTIPCSAEQFLEFVMDVTRYQKVDHKIRPVLWVRRDRNVTEFVFAGRLWGMWTPPLRSRTTLTPGERIDISLAPSAINAPAKLASRFTASFVCSPAPGGGTRVERTLNFDLKHGLQRFERQLQPRLQAEVEEEMDLAAAHFADRAGQTPTS